MIKFIAGRVSNDFSLPIFLLIWWLPLSLHGDELVNAQRRVPRQNTNNEAQCSEFLKRTQSGMIASIEDQLNRLRLTERCLRIKHPSCVGIRAGHLADMKRYREYRKDLGGLDISFNPIGGHFHSVADINGHFRNKIREKVSGLSSGERKGVWNNFEKFQRRFIREWIQQKPSRTYPPWKEDYPNWKQCLKFNNQKLILERKKSIHLFLPKFKSLRGKSISDPIRQHRRECRSLKNYWAKAPFAPELVASYRKKLLPGKKEKESKFKPWMYFLRGKVDKKSKKEQLNLASDAYNRLRSEIEKLLKWTEKLKRDDLLGFEVLVEKLGGKDICSGYSKKTWGDVAKEAGLTLVPGFDMYKALYEDGPINNRIFLAHFIDYDNWNKENTGLNKRILRSGIAAIPQSILEGAVVGKILKIAGKPIKKIIGKITQKPNGGFVKKKAEAKPQNTGRNSTSSWYPRSFSSIFREGKFEGIDQYVSVLHKGQRRPGRILRKGKDGGVLVEFKNAKGKFQKSEFGQGGKVDSILPDPRASSLNYSSPRLVEGEFIPIGIELGADDVFGGVIHKVEGDVVQLKFFNEISEDGVEIVDWSMAEVIKRFREFGNGGVESLPMNFMPVPLANFNKMTASARKKVLTTRMNKLGLTSSGQKISLETKSGSNGLGSMLSRFKNEYGFDLIDVSQNAKATSQLVDYVGKEQRPRLLISRDLLLNPKEARQQLMLLEKNVALGKVLGKKYKIDIRDQEIVANEKSLGVGRMIYNLKKKHGVSVYVEQGYFKAGKSSTRGYADGEKHIALNPNLFDPGNESILKKVLHHEIKHTSTAGRNKPKRFRRKSKPSIRVYSENFEAVTAGRNIAFHTANPDDYVFKGLEGYEKYFRADEVEANLTESAASMSKKASDRVRTFITTQQDLLSKVAGQLENLRRKPDDLETFEIFVEHEIDGVKKKARIDFPLHVYGEIKENEAEGIINEVIEGRLEYFERTLLRLPET